jgi:tetratricopeptide (TPR) repeat protein
MEPSFEYNETDLKALVERFEEMLKKNGSVFFDVEDLEDIIDFYLDNQDGHRAKKAIELAIAQHPGSTAFLVKKARYLVLVNKQQSALNQLDEVEKIDPTNADIYLLKGSILSSMKKSEEAIREYNKAIRYANDPEEVFTSIAYEYESAGDYNNAILHLKKVLEINPDNEPAIYELSFCYEITNQVENGIDFYTQFLDKNPYNKVAWFNLGVCYNNLELFEKAIESYEFAIAIDDTFSSAYFNLANSYANLGEYSHAIKHYKETFKYEEPQALTHYYIGECYEKLNRFRDGIDHYNSCLKEDPEMADAWMGLGVCYDELNESETAVKCMEKALDLEDDNAEFWYIYADLQYKLKDWQNAIKAYERVSAMDPTHPEIWADLADAYIETGQPGKAEEVLEEGIYQQSGNVMLVYRMAALLLREGKQKNGLKMLAHGLQLDFDKHTDLFEAYPQAAEIQEVKDLIKSFATS